jgi:flagellar biosynthesis/type III secretory pathway M-ring protein FliF/YscJ
LVGTVIKLGLAKNDKQAGIVLIVVAVIAVALAFIFWPSGDDYVPVPQPGQDVARVQ